MDCWWNNSSNEKKRSNWLHTSVDACGSSEKRTRISAVMIAGGITAAKRKREVIGWTQAWTLAAAVDKVKICLLLNNTLKEKKRSNLLRTSVDAFGSIVCW